MLIELALVVLSGAGGLVWWQWQAEWITQKQVLSGLHLPANKSRVRS
ncbi:hypothetical protein IC229_32680 [Spirosoma sp. BT702]|uniref:Uncharacterized protein n=1 Tax=Spirosoma profusum TaxID=2771354 RepID=A0A927GAA1_9BACT|nr:hypothetical protein [Spirosoma profusum]MBD2705412.1 hypothetical protein [Spirosoma profusum]